MDQDGLSKRAENVKFPSLEGTVSSSLLAHKVIERLLESCVVLTYNAKRFEIIVIDDSSDGTFAILSSWKKRIPNLKVIHRSTRNGWKGGTLNAGLNNINQKSQYTLVIDADNVLVPNTRKVS
jgi:glycosyltransferase involved in cell wall biosynthesis